MCPTNPNDRAPHDDPTSTALGERWARRLVCSATGEEAPLDQPAFLSEAGKPYLVEYALAPDRGRAWADALAGRPWDLWRYRELLPVIDPDAVATLGEGGTPLIRLRRTEPAHKAGVELMVKEEGGNPTGSFKARGLAMAVARARELGAPGVELPSAGNAALALSAYAAANGLPARLALPEDTPPVIAERCRLHGAEVLSGGRTLVEAGERLAESPSGFWNLSTLKEPYRVEGRRPWASKLAEQLGWRLPDWIVYPTGGGTGIVGMHKAFDELERLGLVGSERPRFVSVQMTGCAPIVRAFERGDEAAEPWDDPATEVYGLRVPKAVGDFLILRALYGDRWTGGGGRGGAADRRGAAGGGGGRAAGRAGRGGLPGGGGGSGGGGGDRSGRAGRRLPDRAPGELRLAAVAGAAAGEGGRRRLPGAGREAPSPGRRENWMAGAANSRLGMARVGPARRMSALADAVHDALRTGPPGPLHSRTGRLARWSAGDCGPRRLPAAQDVLADADTSLSEKQSTRRRVCLAA